MRLFLRDAAAALVLIGVGAAGFIYSLNLPDRAGAWPLWIWGLLILLSLILLAVSCRGFLGARGAPESQAAEDEGTADHLSVRAKLQRVGANVALIVLYGVGVLEIGFYLSTALYLMGHMLYLGVRPLWLTGAVTVGLLAFFFLAFEYALGVLVPRGSLF